MLFTENDTDTNFISKRKLEPEITINFAKYAPRFIAKGKNVITYTDNKKEE